MPSLRTILTGSAVVAPALAGAALAPAAEAPAPAPVVELSVRVTPGKLPIPNGTPLKLRLETRFGSEPPGGDFVLRHADYRFGRGARLNGRLFPSCSVKTLRRARGRLSACPEGSKVGSGVGVGTAVDLGVTGRGTLTMFNGPRGRSLTLNFSVVSPAIVNVTFPARIERLGGERYALKLSTSIPESLKRILDSDIVVSRLDVTAGATRTIDGRRRGYFEALNCPKDGSAVHGDFLFEGGAEASAHVEAVC